MRWAYLRNMLRALAVLTLSAVACGLSLQGSEVAATPDSSVLPNADGGTVVSPDAGTGGDSGASDASVEAGVDAGRFCNGSDLATVVCEDFEDPASAVPLMPAACLQGAVATLKSSSIPPNTTRALEVVLPSHGTVNTPQCGYTRTISILGNAVMEADVLVAEDGEGTYGQHALYLGTGSSEAVYLTIERNGFALEESYVVGGNPAYNTTSNKIPLPSPAAWVHVRLELMPVAKKATLTIDNASRSLALQSETWKTNSFNLTVASVGILKSENRNEETRVFFDNVLVRR
jgi:hypothetical protein